MLTKEDITGVCVYVPTPCKEGEDGWRSTDSVDLDVTARMVEDLIQAGVRIIATCGTTGENAALLWEEKVAFTDTVIQVANGRIPIFAGATALGTREVVRQMRAFKEIGADGAFVGLPLWQTPTPENSVLWYADLSEAMPDMPVMVYSNPNFFKSVFPTPLWEGIARKAPTVIASKGMGADALENIKAAGHQVRFIPTEATAVVNYRQAPEHVKSFWSTAAAMGAEPVVALMEAMLEGDAEGIERVGADIEAVPGWIAKREDFHLYNTQAAKARFRAAGCDYGPTRAPYHDPLPEAWQQAAEAHGKGWIELRKKYVKAKV
ncbi:MAG: dihydrodipicolinate synthase family protein [Dehalococcoidia bacterium]